MNSGPAAHVSAELDGVVHEIGCLWADSSSGRERATFEYSDSWLTSAHRQRVEPALALSPAAFTTTVGQGLTGALGDSAPDGWGRTLMARDERHRAKTEKRDTRPLGELDYLLAVTDETRQGALRFALSESETVTAPIASTVPPLRALSRLGAAADKVAGETESARDLRLLLAPGSPLGGTRAKASVRDGDGSLLIAKFPITADGYRAVEWEAVALCMAGKAGINVVSWRLTRTRANRALLVRRFDRADGTRVPFLSVSSALGENGTESCSYLEIAGLVRSCSASAAEDLVELWRRIVFTVLISNTDDHLQNHGFLYDAQTGWRLSPAYDLNPVPTHVKARELSTAIADDGDHTASLEAALAVADRFGLSVAGARRIIIQVATAVRQWRKEATAMRIPNDEIDRMASAFGA